MVQYSYDAFGETTISGKQAKKTENRYQFNSESTDKVTGLQYLRARYYDSTTGRFITEDTYEGNIYDPLTRNQYLYTNNDPVNYIDPSGHFFKELWEYGKATIKTIGDIGNAVWSIMKDPTPQNIMNQALGTAININNNYSTAKNNIRNYNNSIKIGNTSAKSSSSNKRQQIVIKQGPPYTPNNKNTSYTRPTYGAAVNPKVEKSRQIENQIKLLRQQNTPEANRMADYLQENMKKLCEGSLSKIQAQQLVSQKNSWIKDAAYSVTATIAGFGTTAINNLLGTDLRNVGVFEDYQKAYYGGAIAGDIASTIIGAAETLQLLLDYGTDLDIKTNVGYGIDETGREMLKNFENDYGKVKENVPDYDDIVSIINNLEL